MSKDSSSSTSPGQQLVDTCESGDLDTVRKLLDQGVNVNWNDTFGSTALMWASQEGHAEVVKFLLDRGALPDIQNNIGLTALMYASHFGQVDCTQLLLERGADMSLKNEDGMKARDFAVKQGYADIVQLFNEVCMFQTQDDRFKYRRISDLTDLTRLSFTKYEAKKKSTPHIQSMPELQLPQAQVLGELVMEPLNKALQEENGRLKCENEVLKERELSKNKEILCKQELVDEFKTRSKSVEEENQRAKEEIQRFRDELSSLKEEKISMRVEIEYLKRIDEQLRLERNAERVMFQTMMSNLIGGPDDRKRKRNEDEESK
jgi:hypothetical protein